MGVMEAHAHRHVAVAEVLKDGGLVQAVGVETEYHAAAEFVGKVAEDGIVEGVAVIDSLNLGKAFAVDGARHDKRFAFDDAVVVVVLGRYGDGVLVFAPIKGVGAVGDAVGREEQRESVYLGPFLEVVHLFGVGCAQYVDAGGRVPEFYNVGADRRYHDGFVASCGEMYGGKAVKVDFFNHDILFLKDSFSKIGNILHHIFSSVSLF